MEDHAVRHREISVKEGENWGVFREEKKRGLRWPGLSGGNEERMIS